MIPILNIKQLISKLIDFIYLDCVSSEKEEDTFLYQILYGVKDGNFDFYQQAKSLFLRDQGNPRNVRVLIEYPKDRNSFPCYVIREPGKRDGADNSIGKIRNYSSTGVPFYRDARSSDFEIMCLSANMFESVILSEVLYALLVASYDMLASQYETINFSIRELMAESEIMPMPFFIKSVSLSVSMNNIIPGLCKEELLSKVLFEDAGLAAYFLEGEK